MIHVLTGITLYEGAQWLSGRALDSRPRGRGFEPHRREDRLLMGRNESNQTKNKQITLYVFPHVITKHKRKSDFTKISCVGILLGREPKNPVLGFRMK